MNTNEDAILQQPPGPSRHSPDSDLRTCPLTIATADISVFIRTTMVEIARKLRRFLARAQSRSVWECVELAPAVERRRSSKAGASSTQSRTLRAVRLRLCRDVESLIPNLYSRPLMSITSCIESLQLQTDARRRPHGPHASARVTARVAPQKTPVNIASARVHGYRGVRGPLRSVQSSRFKVQGSRFKVQGSRF